MSTKIKPELYCFDGKLEHFGDTQFDCFLPGRLTAYTQAVAKEAAEKAWLAADAAWMDSEMSVPPERYYENIEEHRAEFEEYWKSKEKE